LDAALVARIAGSLVVAYLLGAVPFALILGKGFFKVDVREHGSGNLGATNVMRVLGWRAALATLALDVAKGALAVYAAGFVVPTATFGASIHEWSMIGATIAAMTGHSFSPYIGFRGGKGVAAGAGALLVLVPLAWPILFLTWLAVIAVTRMVSLGSIVIAVEYPVLMLVLYQGDWPLLAVAIVVACLVTFRHSANIGRIVRGQEPKISLTREPSAQEKGGA
jgi:acyl phosphate:glycerol-3-phosphate acyltransferase